MTTVRVNGLRSLLRATDQADKATKKLVRGELRKAAEPVRQEAAARFQPISPRSAARFGISVRKAGTVSVEQRLRRTTGTRPDFGATQMREALVPALENRQDEVVRSLDDTLKRLEQEWVRG